MKINEVKSVVDIIRDSTRGELFFTSLIILPIYLGSWIVVLKQLDKELWRNELLILAILITGYIVTLYILKTFQSKEKEIERASIKIRSYIISRSWTRMSYDRIKKSIDTNYSEELLTSVIDNYPEDFRKGTIKGGKKAIVILGEEQDN